MSERCGVHEGLFETFPLISNIVHAVPIRKGTVKNNK